MGDGDKLPCGKEEDFRKSTLRKEIQRTEKKKITLF